MIDRPMPAQFFLTKEEKDSHLWARLVGHMEKRLEDARKENEGNRTEAETARLRGRIAELRELISLSTKLPAVVANEPPR